MEMKHLDFILHCVNNETSWIWSRFKKKKQDFFLDVKGLFCITRVQFLPKF
jgi:hypothetical protein